MRKSVWILVIGLCVLAMGVLASVSSNIFTAGSNTLDASGLTVNDVDADTGTFNNVSAGEVYADNFYFGNTTGMNNATNPDRPFILNHEVNKSVCPSGCDYTSINAALRDLPFILQYNYLIYVGDGYYDEDVYIPPIISAQKRPTEGSIGGLRIKGNGTNFNTVIIKSISSNNQIGQWSFGVDHVTINGTEPTSDENVCVSHYGDGFVSYDTVNFTGGCSSATYAAMAYGSGIYITRSYFEGQDYALLVKRKGNGIFGDGYNDAGNNGSVNIAVVSASDSIVEISPNNRVSAPNKFINGNALVMHNGTILNLNVSKDYLKVGQNLTNVSTIKKITLGNLILGMSMDDLRSSRILDSSDRSNHGTKVSTVLQHSQDGFNKGSYIETDGSSSYVVINNTLNDFNLTQNYTINLWFRTTQSTNGAFMSIGSSSSTNPFVIFDIGASSAGNIRYTVRNDSNSQIEIEDTNYAYNNGLWHMVTLNKYDNTYDLYIDGEAKQTGSYSIGEADVNIATLGALRRTTTSLYYDGDLDNVGIWNQSLTGTQIKAMYEQRFEFDKSKVSQTDLQSDGSGNVGIFTNKKFCLDDPITCTAYTTYNGSCIIAHAPNGSINPIVCG